MNWNIDLDKELNNKTDEARKALQKLLARKDIGFFNVENIKNAIDEVKQIIAPKLNGRLHVFGIGGSSLGAETLISLLPIEKSSRVIFHDNIDCLSFKKKLSLLNSENIKNDDWMLISKSGGTLESLAQYNFLRQYVKKNFSYDIKQNTYVITEKKSNPLYDWAKNENVKTLSIPIDVGGRFSVFTPVGLAPIYWLGEDIDPILSSFKYALGLDELVVKLTSGIAVCFEEKIQITYFMSYADDLSYWGKWISQLWAESLGKSKSRSNGVAPFASIPVYFRGATDQHSILQQIVEGAHKKMAIFFEIEESQKSDLILEEDIFKSGKLIAGMTLGDLLNYEMIGTRQSLQDNGIKTIKLSCLKLDVCSVSVLMLVFELVIGALGELMDINAFDQPGVEQGKAIAVKLLRQSR